MANYDELITKVLHGTMNCSIRPEKDDCRDCPYREENDDFCIARLCTDAHTAILHLDMLVSQMIERGGGE